MLLTLLADSGAQAAPASVIPVFSSLVLGGDGVTLSGTLNTDIVSPGGDYKLGFSANVNGSAVTISSAARSPNNVITFTLASKSYQGDTVILSYSSATGDIESAVGANELASFPDAAVTNNAAPWTPAELAAADATRRVAWFVPGTFFEDSAKTTPAADAGDVVGAWDDSQNLWDITQATTAKKAILQADGGILVGGTNKLWLDHQNISPTISRTAAKALGVRFKPGASASGQNPVFCTTGSTGSPHEAINLNATADRVVFSVRSSSTTPSTAISSAAKVTAILRQEGASSATGYVNGNSTNLNTGTATAASYRVRAGGEAVSGVSATLYAACSVIGGTVLSDAEIARLDTFLDGY